MIRSRLLAIAVVTASLFVFCSSAGAYGQLGAVNPVGGGPDAENFSLANPGEIRLAPDGGFFLVDQSNSKIVRLSATGQYMYAFGGPTQADPGTYLPVSLALAPSGGADPDVIVALSSGVIKRFSAAGTFIAKATIPGGSGMFLAVDPAWGDLYAAGYSANNVRRIALGDSNCTPGTTEQFGDVLETFGQGAGISDLGQPGKLWNPHSLEFDSTGRLFVMDRSQNRVSVFIRSANCSPWTYETKFGNNSSGDPQQMSAPEAIAIDRGASPNKIYVTQTYLDNIVQAFTGDSFGNAPFVYHGRWGTTVPYGTPVGNGPDDLSYPAGIAVSGSNAWVSENANDRIHLYTGVSAATPFSAPVSAGTWGHSGYEDGFFSRQGQLAAAPDGSFYALDQFKDRVQHFSPRGELLNAWGENGSSPGQFEFRPSSIAVTDSGEVLLNGTTGIQRFSAAGNYLGVITWPALAPPDPISPGPMTVDHAGHIWVFDWSGGKVLKLDATGNVLASFGSYGFDAGGSIANLGDLAVSGDGKTVHVLDAGTNLIKTFESGDGTNYAFARASQPSTGAGTSDGRLSGPTSIELDATRDQLVVSDSGNNRIQRFATDDLSFVSKYGTYGLGGGDHLIYPIGLAVDRWGNLWSGDQGNDRVLRFGDAPQVTVAPVADTQATSAVLSYSTTDPASDCNVAPGTTVSLAVGANSFTVTCTNAEGSGSGTVTINRLASPPPEVTPAQPTLKFPKKLKLSARNKFSFFATCPVGCKVTGSVKVGRSSSATKGATLAGRDAAQTVSLRVASKLAKKIRAALKAKKKVTLNVNVVAYGAKQGKSGSAIVRK